MGLPRHDAPASARTMNRQSIFLAVLCAIGGAGVATLVIDRDADTDASQVSALQRRLAAVENRVATRQSQQREGPVEPPVQRTQRPASSEPLEPRAFAVPDEQVLSPLAEAAADAERRRYEAGVFEQALAAEQVDVSASNAFAQGLTQAFGGVPELAGNQLLDAQCRVSLCRIAVLHRSDDDMESFLGSIGNLPGLENTDTYWQREIHADGSSVMTMYVARTGHALPDYQVQGPGSFTSHAGGS